MAKSTATLENGKLKIREVANHPENRARKALKDVNEALTDLTDNWDGLSQAAKLNAVKRGVIIALRVVKWLASKDD